MKIGTNITATIAATSLAKNERAMAQSIQRVSTGLKINSAADDVAGLAMVDRMTAQSKGLSQAVQNANDAIGMIQTADGAISGVTEMLQRMRELSVQAVGDTNTAKDRQALDLEYQALKSELSRVFSQTQWNGENLLDGSHFGATTSFQVGANLSQTIDMSLGVFSTATLGRTTNYGSHLSAAPASVEVSQPTSSYVTTNDTTGTWTQRGTDIDGEATGDLSGSYVAMSADASIVAVGAHANDSNGNNSGHVRIYQNNGGIWTSIGEITGVASDDLAGAVSLSSDGRTIALGARENDDGPGDNSGHVRMFNYDGSSWNQVGDAILGSAESDHSGYSVALSGDGKTVAIGAKDHDDGANGNAGQVRVYHNENGIWTLVTTHTGSAGSDEFGVSVALSDDGRTFAAGAWQTASDEGYVRACQLAPYLTTQTTVGMEIGNDKNTTSERLDQLITNVATQRATFGAQLNRLSYAVDNLASSALATDAARGRIEDANYANETTALARSQIISQAGTAMLAQANQKAASVLSLLR